MLIIPLRGEAACVRYGVPGSAGNPCCGRALLGLIGVLGEYVGRIYGEAKHRPLYIVKERLGFPSPVARPAALQSCSCPSRASLRARLPVLSRAPVGPFPRRMALAGRSFQSGRPSHRAALGIVRSTPRTLALLVLSAVVRVCEGGAFVVLAEALIPAAALALIVHALWLPLTAVVLACCWLPSAADGTNLRRRN